MQDSSMSIASNLKTVRQQINDATLKAHRAANSVTLLAVSKAQKINHIQEAFMAGQKLFGESYLTEALPKIEALQSLPIEWHFIGPIQSNKTRDIAHHFQWVHSVDRIKVARRLNEQRDQLPPLNVTVQVNLFNESTKQGASLEELPELLAFVSEQPQLILRGLMSIPPRQKEPQLQLKQFLQVKQVFDQFRQHYPNMDTLSMGMSGDLTAAIEAGSTLVRVGTALFGARPADWKQGLVDCKTSSNSTQRDHH
jgi:hypothetical protein